MYLLKNFNNFPQFSRLRYAIKPFKRYESNDLNVIKSKSTKIAIPNQLINEYVWKNCDKWRNKTALICFETGRSYTFDELRIKSSTLANNLRNNLQINNATVAIILPNIPEFVISFLGVLEAGLLITPVNPFYTTDEILRQLENSGATIIFTFIELSTIIKQSKLNKNFTIIVIDLKNETIPEGFLRFTDLISGNSNEISSNLRQSPDEIAILPYSSGTIGFTKGVQLTHRNVVANLSQMSSPDFRINYETRNDFQDVVPVFLPLFHIYGLVVVFLNFLSQGCKLITIPKFIPSQFGRLLKTYQPTLIFAVPQIINSIVINSKLKYDDLKCIRTIASAAAPLGNDAVTNFNKKTYGRINLLQIYGMTETSPLTLMQTVSLENGKKIGGSGFLLPNTRAKILPLDNNTNKIGLSPYEIGELVVKGPQIMQGYHKNPEATNRVLNDGWLRTGDVGYYDTDQHFFITDRLKELIKVKGFQVAPAELEEVLLKHPSVVDCAVIGVPHRVQGEAPKAFVVLKMNQTTKPEELKEFVANRVANYKRLIGGCVIIDKIPRNCAGKVLRRLLRQL